MPFLFSIVLSFLHPVGFLPGLFFFLPGSVTPGCLLPSACAASGVHYIIDGQHVYTAAQAIRQSCLDDRRPVPPWTEKFRCAILKEMDVEQVKAVAGRLQRASQAVVSLKFSETMTLFLNEHKRAPFASVSDLLRLTYRLSGKSTTTDGSVVSSPALPWLPPFPVWPWLAVGCFAVLCVSL